MDSNVNWAEEASDTEDTLLSTKEIKKECTEEIKKECMEEIKKECMGEIKNSDTSIKRKIMQNSNKNDSRHQISKRERLQKRKKVCETDPEILQRRQKQIDYGKNTVGYFNYIQQVPRDQRGHDDPETPDKYYKYSRRSWDTLIKIWRKKLHKYDPDSLNDDKDLDLD